MLTHAQQRALQEALDTFVADGGDESMLRGPLVAESPQFGTVLMQGRVLNSEFGDDIELGEEGTLYYSICRPDGMWSPAIIPDSISEMMASIVIGITWEDGRPVEPSDWPETMIADSEFDSLGL